MLDPMGKERCPGFQLDRATVKELADDLCTESSPKTTLDSLRDVSQVFRDSAARDNLALDFLQANGLHGIVRHLSGCAQNPGTTDADITASDISDAAATAFSHVLSCMLVERYWTTGRVHDVHKIAPLINAFGNHMLALRLRLKAAQALTVNAAFLPEGGKAMAEGGVMQAVLNYYIQFCNEGYASNALTPAALLAERLVKSETVAARQLDLAIRAPETVQAFAALVVLQVCIFDVIPST
jgi:hypothetical protein